MWPSVTAILSRTAGDRTQGAIQGIAGSIGAVASILGLLTGGILLGLIGPRIFLLAGAIILGVFILAFRLTPRGAPVPGSR
jgi:MFS family permease